MTPQQTESVLTALAPTAEHHFRTVAGLSEETGLREDRVRKILVANRDKIRMSERRGDGAVLVALA